LEYLPLEDLKVVDLDTAKPLAVSKSGGKASAALEVPITEDKQSVHLKITGTIAKSGYQATGNELVFQRTLKGLRNTIVLPKGWEVSSVSQSGTIGTDRNGRVFVALVNLNGENNYNVTIRARK